MNLLVRPSANFSFDKRVSVVSLYQFLGSTLFLLSLAF